VLWCVLCCCWSTGTLEHVVNEHTGPVFVLKWNKRGDMVITGSLQGAKVLEATNWSVAQDLTQLASKQGQCSEV
jgi:hypothetical protein